MVQDCVMRCTNRDQDTLLKDDGEPAFGWLLSSATLVCFIAFNLISSTQNLPSGEPL